MNIIAAILFGIYGVIGGVSTVVCTISIPYHYLENLPENEIS